MLPTFCIETSDRDIGSDTPNFNYDVENASITTASFDGDALSERGNVVSSLSGSKSAEDFEEAGATAADSGATIRAPTKFFSRSSNDGDAEDNIDEEEKHDVESEKHLINDNDNMDPVIVDVNQICLDSKEMKMDSILVQRAFEGLKRENARLNEW